MSYSKEKGRLILAFTVPILLSFPALWGIITYPWEKEAIERELSWLHVDGRYIKDEKDRIVYLRGTGVGDLTWSTRWAGERAPGDLDELIQRINQLPRLTGDRANVIRVAITPNPKVTFPEDMYYPWNATLVDVQMNIWETEIHPEVYNEQVDAIVSLAGSNNIYLIIEFHCGFTSPENIGRYGDDPLGYNSYVAALALDPTPLIDWHLHWVNRYVDNHVVVGFEIWNEPWDAAFGYGDRDFGRERYINMTLKVIDAIDRANPKALMILTSAPFGYIHQDFIDLHPLPYNVVYGWHSYYKGWPDYWKQEYAAGDWIAAFNKTLYKLQRDHIGKAMKAGLPLIATEFGWWARVDWEPAWDHQMHDYLSILNDWKTNWVVWSWWGNPQHMGLANNFDYTELSPHGKIWKKHLWDGIQTSH
jgi:hypothetical protein